eukprot:COSAG02_NODE_273_length_26316_cov_13.661060_13_plen_100_part_00
MPSIRGAPATVVIDEVSLRGEPSAGANVSPLCRVCLHNEAKIVDHLNVGRASSYMCDRLCFNINFIWSNQSVLTFADFPRRRARGAACRPRRRPIRGTY